MVQLTDDLVASLDRAAQRRGVSRSALIRAAIEAFLAEDVEAEVTRQIVEGYLRIPPGTPDEWGDLDAMTDHAHRDVLRSIADEERQAGIPPWTKKAKKVRGRPR